MHMLSSVWQRQIGLSMGVLRFFVLLWLIILATAASHVMASVNLTPEERAWLKANPDIKLAAFSSQAPSLMSDAQGRTVGIIADVFQHINRAVGQDMVLMVPADVKVTFHELAKTKGFYGAANVFRTPQTESLYRLSQPYLATPFYIVTSQKKKNTITKLADLKGKKVAVPRGHIATSNFIIAAGGKVVIADTPLEQMRMVLAGQADALVGYVTYSYLMHKYLMSDLVIAFVTQSEQTLHVGINPEHPLLQSILNKAIATLDEKTIADIFAKWTDVQNEHLKSINLTSKERAWIAAHPKIVLGTDQNWAPYVIRNPDGSVGGIDADLLERINALTGLNLQIELGQWTEIQQRAQSKKIDGLLLATYQKAREPYFLFSDSTYSTHKYIFAYKKDVAAYKDMKSLAGKRVAYQRGNMFEEGLLARYPDIKGVPLGSNRESLESLIRGEVDAVIASYDFQYILRERMLSEIVVSFIAPDSELRLLYCIRKDWPELHAIINKALAVIPVHERLAIVEHYLGRMQPVAKPIPLTPSEQAWLNAKRTVRVRISDWPPYTFTQPGPSGLAVDTLNAVAHRLGFEVEYVVDTLGREASQEDLKGPRRYYDLILAMNRTLERQKQFAFTRDYLSSPWVIFTREDASLISSLDGLKGKTIAAEKGVVVTAKLRSGYPDIHLLEVDSSVAALEAVATGKADAYIGNLRTNTYLIKTHHLDNLMVVAPSPFGEHTNAMAVRADWPELAALIDKGLANMTAEEKNAISEKWGRVEIKPQTDYTLVWEMALGALLVLLAILYWNWTLQRARREALAARQAADTARRELETIIDHLPAIFFTKDTEGRYRMINQHYVDEVGTPREQVIGHLDEEIHIAEVAEKIREVDAAVLQDKAVRVFEERVPAAGGIYHDYLTTKAPLLDERGQAYGIVGIATDITAQKNIEMQLKQANEQLVMARDAAEAAEIRYRTVADYTYDWETLNDGSGHWLYCSPACKRVSGHGAESFIDDPQLFLDIVHPDDRDKVRAHMESTCHASGSFGQLLFRIVRPDGDEAWLEHVCQPVFDKDGKFIGHRASNRDITQRKHIEETLKALAVTFSELSGKPFFDAVCGHIANTLGVDYVFVGRYEAPQDSIRVIGGYARGQVMDELAYTLADTPCSTVVGQTPCFYPSNLQALFPKDVLLAKMGVESYAGIPLFDKQRNPIGILVLLHSQPLASVLAIGELLQVFSERVAAEMQRSETEALLKRAREEAEAGREAADRGSRAKSIFLANMSHELRTPLSAILGFSDILRRDPSIGERQQERLAVILKSGNHLLSLINDVLDIAKIEAGKMQLEPAPFDLGGVVLDVTEMLRIRAQEKGIRLTLDETSSFPRYILGDEAKIRQILINLLSNAVKATEKGSVTLFLGTAPDKAGRLIIKVVDTGCGIAPDDQAKILQPFVQIGQAGKQQGTGLGLAITRQFVDMMNGSLSLTSEVGQGSVFRVEIEVQSARQEDVGHAPPDAGEVIGLEPGQPSYRVLVAEDYPDNQALMVHLLEGAGFEVRLAVNGAEAVALFQEWRPDFIWMDRRMPVMDGVEAVKRIRALPGGDRVKIAAVTASAFKSDDIELSAAGFECIVHKPFRLSQIFTCMERLLNTRFQRADTETAPEQLMPLSAKVLAALPQAQRQALHDALLLLESRRISEAIDAIGLSNAGLAAALRERAAKYDYGSLLALLRNAPP